MRSYATAMVLLDEKNQQVQLFVSKLNEHLSTLRPKTRIENVAIRFEGRTAEKSFKLIPLERMTVLTVEAWKALNDHVEKELETLVNELMNEAS